MPALALALLSACLLGGTALLIAAAPPLRSTLAIGLAAYVIAWTDIVVVTELLSLGRLVTLPWYVALQTPLFAAALAVWWAWGGRRPSVPALDFTVVRRHPVVAALAFVVVAAVVYQAFLVVATPPNNGDSLSGHLSRVALWYEHAGIHWIPDAHTPRQNEWPPNAQIGVLYSVVLLDGRDTLAALPQLLAALAFAGAVAGMARGLGCSRAAAAFSALITLTLPQIALQSVTTQNDLTAASFVGVSGYFLHQRTAPAVVLAALACALALGTKVTAVLALPILGALALVLLPRRQLAVAAAASIAGFAVVGAAGYARNAVETGDPLGSGTAQSGYRPTAITVRGTTSSLAKLAWHMLDFSGYPLKPAIRSLIADGGDAAFNALGIDTYPLESSAFPFTFDPNIRAEEDTSWYGPLGFLLLVPAAIYAVARWRPRRAPPALLVHGLAVPVYAVLLVLAYKEGSWYGRYLLGSVVFALPLVAFVYRIRLLAAGAAIVGAVTLGLVHAANANKPTGFEKTPVWTLERPEAQSLGLPGYERVIRATDANAEPGERIGAVMGEQDWSYPLFGPRLERPIVFLERRGVLEAAERRELDVVVLGRNVRPPTDPAGWRVIRFEWMGTVLVRDRG